ncbi:hypothetical protein WA158_006260 [Blastocystis sp. Blastoise]
MEWNDMPLDSFVYACAKYSGPIALKWDNTSIIPNHCKEEYTTNLLICSPNGKLVNQLPPRSDESWSKGYLLCLGWTISERLFCVYQDGTIVVYTMFGILISHTKVIEESLTDSILCAQPTENGVVVYTTQGKLLYIDIDSMTLNKLTIPQEYSSPRIPAGEKLQAMAIIEQRYSRSNTLEIICVTDGGHISICGGESVETQLPSTFDTVNKVALSPNNQLLAIYSSTGEIIVYSQYCSSIVYTFTLSDCKIPPKQFTWCGNEAIAVYWTSIGLLLLDLHSNGIKYTYDTRDHLFLIPEIDCLRIYTYNTHEIIRKVCQPIQDVYVDNNFVLSENSPPGTELMYCYNQYREKNGAGSLVNKNAPFQGVKLYLGIYECVIAAQEQFSTYLQKDYLNAARFGLCFYDVDSKEFPTKFVTDINGNNLFVTEFIPATSKMLRLLNSFRQHDLALYLTCEELKSLSLEAVISRLLQRRHHDLALQICSLFGLSNSQILIHWCIEVIKSKTELGTQELLDIITKKIQNYKTDEPIHYAQLARAAEEVGNTQLAAELINFEPSIEEQISMLLTLQEDEKALRKAIETNSSDLVMKVILGLIKSDGTLDENQLLTLLSQNPAIYSVVLHYFRETQFSIYSSLVKNLNLNSLYMKGILYGLIVTMKSGDYEGAYNDIQMIADSLPKEELFLKGELDTQRKLLLFQRNIQAGIPDVNIMGKTMVDTLYEMVVHHRMEDIKSFKKTFKITDKKYYHVVIKAYTENSLYDDLLAFANMKKSPIGYEPFARACIKQNAINQAVPFIQKISDNKQRLPLLIETKQWSEAIEIAGKLNDKQSLVFIAKNCNDNTLVNKANIFLSS